MSGPPLTTSVRYGTAVAFLLVVSSFDPETTWWFPSCPLHALTGVLCPLCGSLRAFHALVLGAPLAALAFNPLAIAGLGAWLLARDRTTAFLFSIRGLTLFLGFGLVRNL